jgi:hypothetical protein
MGRLPNEGLDAVQNMLAALAPLMIGIRRQAAPPLRFGTQRLHRMHVLVMGPHQPFEAPSPSDDLEQVLPRLNRWPAEAKARPILGEILRGEKGEWYERIGNRIRPLRQLVSGPNGEVLEVPSNYLPENGRGQTADAEVCEESAEEEETAAAQPEPRETAPPRGAPTSSGFRRLIAEPGTWRVLPFGGFKLLLASQLSHPARLRDSHRIPCHLEVFEAIMPQRIDALARAILGEAAGPTDLQPLTPALVAQLDLTQLLPAPVRVPPFSPEQGGVRPGQRFFRLVVANDPTAPPPATTNAASTVPNSQSETTSAQTPGQAAPARATAIPVHLLQPWEFCRSREEAIALLLQSDSWWTRITRPLRRMMHRGALRRWQLFLSGRSADEQLWSVPPPRGWLGDAWLREWARHTLEAGGYDSAAMLPEWEIFWGRKTRP